VVRACKTTSVSPCVRKRAPAISQFMRDRPQWTRLPGLCFQEIRDRFPFRLQVCRRELRDLFHKLLAISIVPLYHRQKLLLQHREALSQITVTATGGRSDQNYRISSDGSDRNHPDEQYGIRTELDLLRKRKSKLHILWSRVRPLRRKRYLFLSDGDRRDRL
jgi:hypothetical protein